MPSSSPSSPAAAVSMRPPARVAVCGAGVMGAQIAAHCVNAGVPVVLFDLTATEGDRRAVARRAIEQLGRLRPAPLADPALAAQIVPACYDDDLHLLADCDLVIEAIAERLDWKRDLYQRLAPALGEHALLATNTSGLSIETLAQALPETLRPRFCGVHFFNPPRYMPLVELVPTRQTRPEWLDRLETFLTTGLGKRVVRVKDTPNFIGNRIGIFGMLAVFEQAARHGLPVDLVDDLTGTRLGRASSGTFRTADVVGLDTFALVVRTLREQLPDDPFHALYAEPPVLTALIARGALGQKTGEGYYRREGRTILRLDAGSGDYVPAGAQADPAVAAILAERDPAARMRALRTASHPQARFLWAVLRDTLHYSAVHLADIADHARQVDQAMRWGFGHAQGPFEIWQAAGWREVAAWIQEDIDAGLALVAEPLPDWVTDGPVWKAGGVHTPEGSWNPTERRFDGYSTLPVYQRQITPLRLVGEATPLVRHVVYEDEAIRCWTLPAPYPRDVLITSFKTRRHQVTAAVAAGMTHAVGLAEQDYRALVVAQESDPACGGTAWQWPDEGGAAVQTAADAQIRAMQQMVVRVAQAQVPVVVALAGQVQGAGAELALHAARRVAHLETRLGLIDASLGLVPSAGGLWWAAREAARRLSLAPDSGWEAQLAPVLDALASSWVSGSALEARARAWLLPGDPVVMHRDELLYVAAREAQALADAGWRAPLPARFPVAGRAVAQSLAARWAQAQPAGQASAHDAWVVGQLADALCGGDAEAGALVDAAWMLARERETCLQLLAEPLTLARVQAWTATGKPLRN